MKRILLLLVMFWTIPGVNTVFAQGLEPPLSEENVGLQDDIQQDTTAYTPEEESEHCEQPVQYIREITACDKANDAGGCVKIEWLIGSDEIIPDNLVVFRMNTETREMLPLDTLSGASTKFTDNTTEDGITYDYWILPYKSGIPLLMSPKTEAVSEAQWIHSGRISMLILLVILSVIIIWYIESAKKGKNLYIREIGGLSAVDDAVGRATEMGKAVLYIPGIMDMDDIQTIASMVILGRVAAKTAEYGSSLLVPTCKSVVMSVAQEVVKESYIQQGRPDAYSKENIQYLTDDQFGYAAGVDGIMVREKPAAIFLLGTFYAESLILAETGRSVGAIQIAGTAMPSQIPFFIAACDYTLIGEELFAASAYLSREPKLLGSLKGQDVAKLIFIIIIVAGVIAATIGTFWHPLQDVAEFIRNLVKVN